MLRFNESIIHLEFGSTVGSHPNRLGNEVCEKIGKVFETGVTLLQFLSLSGTSICAEDLQKISDSICKSNYKYLHTLDISNNRLTGVAAGNAIASLLKREQNEQGYYLTNLNVSQNKLENKGAGMIFSALLDPNCHLKILNMTRVSITMAEGVTVITTT
jgi:hypothetical protein